MEFLAFPALILAVAACIFAVLAERRARRATRAFARELVQLRHALSDRPPPSAAAPGADVGETEAAWREALGMRLEQAERRVLELEEQDLVGDPAAAVSGRALKLGTAGIRDLVRAGLRKQGYTGVVVLDLEGDDGAVVEAEREGVHRKGIARITPQGRVVFEARSSLRAFP